MSADSSEKSFPAMMVVIPHEPSDCTKVTEMEDTDMPGINWNCPTV